MTSATESKIDTLMLRTDWLERLKVWSDLLRVFSNGWRRNRQRKHGRCHQALDSGNKKWGQIMETTIYIDLLYSII